MGASCQEFTTQQSCSMSGVCRPNLLAFSHRRKTHSASGCRQCGQTLPNVWTPRVGQAASQSTTTLRGNRWCLKRLQMSLRRTIKGKSVQCGIAWSTKGTEATRAGQPQLFPGALWYEFTVWQSLLSTRLTTHCALSFLCLYVIFP